jgi:uncharacterized protein (TIGR02246 family)
MRQIRHFAAAIAASLPAFVLAASGLGNNLGPLSRTEIKVENERWADAFRRCDYEAIARLYTPDGTLLPPGGNSVTGADAIAQYFASSHAGGCKADTVTFSNAEFYGNEQIVTEVSDVEIRAETGKLKFRGKQMLIFLNRGGVWKLHRDLWNPSPKA